MTQRPTPTFFVPMLQEDPRAVRGTGSPKLMWMPRTEALPRRTDTSTPAHNAPSPADRDIR